MKRFLETLALLGRIMAEQTRTRDNLDFVTTSCRPGVTKLRMLDRDGKVQAQVILSLVTHDLVNGTSAEFVDFYDYVARRTLTRVHELDCTRGLHTEAEGCS